MKVLLVENVQWNVYKQLSVFRYFYCWSQNRARNSFGTSFWFLLFWRENWARWAWHNFHQLHMIFTLFFSVTFWKHVSNAARQTKNELDQHGWNYRAQTSFICWNCGLWGPGSSNLTLAILFSCGFLVFAAPQNKNHSWPRVIRTMQWWPGQLSTAVIKRNLTFWTMNWSKWKSTDFSKF